MCGDIFLCEERVEYWIKIKAYLADTAVRLQFFWEEDRSYKSMEEKC